MGCAAPSMTWRISWAGALDSLRRVPGSCFNTSMRMLVTAFEPFDDAINASQQIVEELARQQLAPELAFEVLACDSSTLANQWRSVVERHRPGLCLLLGQARERSELCFEQQAFNELRFSRPDNAGRQPSRGAIIEGAPDSLFSTLPRQSELVQGVLRRGLPARLSNDPGRYLCNQLFYLALYDAQLPVPGWGSRRGGDEVSQVGFVHVPALPCQRTLPGVRTLPVEQAAAALLYVIEQLLQLGGSQPGTRSI
jgi:pyroglutamyl-peptidase